MDEIFDPSGLTALVIDPNHYHRRIALDQLRTMGFGRALGASETHEAWDIVRRSNPDVVLIEWIEGELTGLDFVRRMRTSVEAPNRTAAVFMLTTRGAQTDVETARLAGVDGYMIKPISALSLQQRLATVVLKPQPFISTETYIGPCRRRRREDSYPGPFRRLTDAVPAVSDHTDEAMAEAARARVTALRSFAESLTPGDPAAARIVFKTAQELLEAAEQIGDTTLALATREMMRYVEAQGATPRLDPEVVRTHVTALYQLAHLPHAQTAERDRVAQSLKRMVDKKLRQVHAA